MHCAIEANLELTAVKALLRALPLSTVSGHHVKTNALEKCQPIRLRSASPGDWQSHVCGTTGSLEAHLLWDQLIL